MNKFSLRFSAGTKAESIYILLPLLIMAGVRFFDSGWRSVILTADWSLAACILYGQSTYVITKAVLGSKIKADPEKFGLYVCVRFTLACMALVSYVLMMIQPDFLMGMIQIFLFAIALRNHFKDKILANLFAGK